VERRFAQRLAELGDAGVWVLVRTIRGMSVNKAIRVVWEAHTKGQAVAQMCHEELADLYEDRLREKGLTTSIKPAG
jgi:ATP-dependent Clp protease adaptor protein ClpS